LAYRVCEYVTGFCKRTCLHSLGCDVRALFDKVSEDIQDRGIIER